MRLCCWVSRNPFEDSLRYNKRPKRGLNVCQLWMSAALCRYLLWYSTSGPFRDPGGAQAQHIPALLKHFVTVNTSQRSFCLWVGAYPTHRSCLITALVHGHFFIYAYIHSVTVIQDWHLHKPRETVAGIWAGYIKGLVLLTWGMKENINHKHQLNF